MEFLKDKKNLPIVVALLVFVMLAAGGFIAYNSGLFSGSQSAGVTSPPVSSAVSSGLPPTGVPPSGVPGGLPAGGGRRPTRGFPPGVEAKSRISAATPAAGGVAAKKPVSSNPLVGPDPFKIPGAAQKVATAAKAIAGLRLPLRDEVGPLNLFQLRPSAPPVPPTLPDTNTSNQTNPAANYRLSGVITGSDGINAILEVGGQSQSVKPGDSLPDGTQVQNIQTTSITLRTAGGSVINLPLSAGTPDQGQGGAFNGGGQFQPGFSPGFNPGFNGRPQFNPQGPNN